WCSQMVGEYRIFLKMGLPRAPLDLVELRGSPIELFVLPAGLSLPYCVVEGGWTEAIVVGETTRVRVVCFDAFGNSPCKLEGEWFELEIRSPGVSRLRGARARERKQRMEGGKVRDGVWSAGRGREELGRRRSKGAVDADAGGEKASVRRKPTLKQMLSSASEQARWLPLLSPLLLLGSAHFPA
ncbi:MAG: hypothetical protein SGPRY_012827, partial [Prymnesium sp.]